MVDDIADSFDYQNKYAIIQYLRDISEDPLFKQIIMTHNCDFFRTINSRFVSYQHCRMATKATDGIAIDQAAGIKNVFVNDWKVNFFTDRKKKVASIPFIRNLVEYTKGDSDPLFLQLTSLLHWKADSQSIREADLDAAYVQMFGGKAPANKSNTAAVELIMAAANASLAATDGVSFESKIVLAIAIRLTAEQFMVAKIADSAFVAGISSNQTQELLRRFKADFQGDAAIAVLDRVMTMTPENIHLNSFMYEPIVDMSGEHLRKLYAEVLALK